MYEKKDIEIKEFPNIVNLEVYRGKCPCKCEHCPVGIMDYKDREQFYGFKEIDLDLYKKISDEVSGHVDSVLRLHSVGEPVLWSDIGEAVEYSHNTNTNTWLFTSAVTNDQELLEKICSNVDIIEVSVNSNDSEDYHKTKGIDAYEMVVSNVHRMSEYIAKKNLDTRLITSRVQTVSEEMDKKFVDYWMQKGVVADSFIRSYHRYNNLLDELSVEEINKEKYEPCLVHWSRFNVGVDGRVIVCFNELFKDKIDQRLVLGDLNSEKIENVWKNEKYERIRDIALEGKFDEDNYLPCQECTSCQPLFTTRETSEAQIRKMKEDVK